jgi:predicted Fe-Mo cluster-binding NifX family protein
MQKKIAIPVKNNELSIHFGLAERFYIYTLQGKEIIEKEVLTPPPHDTGTFPKWLKELGVTDVISSGIGQKALDWFSTVNVKVFTGVEEKEPKELIREFLSGTLKQNINFCDH